MSTVADRKAEYSSFQYSNNPLLADIQAQSIQYYIDNGVWDAGLHEKAEKLRKQIDPSYLGSADGSGYKDGILNLNLNGGGKIDGWGQSMTSGSSIFDRFSNTLIGTDVNGLINIGVFGFILIIVYNLIAKR